MNDEEKDEVILVKLITEVETFFKIDENNHSSDLNSELRLRIIQNAYENMNEEN